MSKVDPELIDSENPEWDDAMFAKAKRGSAAARKVGRPKSETPKVQKTLRLSQEVLDFFQEGGRGWQTRIDDVLKEHVSKHR